MLVIFAGTHCVRVPNLQPIVQKPAIFRDFVAAKSRSIEHLIIISYSGLILRSTEQMQAACFGKKLVGGEGIIRKQNNMYRKKIDVDVINDVLKALMEAQPHS